MPVDGEGGEVVVRKEDVAYPLELGRGGGVQEFNWSFTGTSRSLLVEYVR